MPHNCSTRGKVGWLPASGQLETRGRCRIFAYRCLGRCKTRRWRCSGSRPQPCKLCASAMNTPPTCSFTFALFKMPLGLLSCCTRRRCENQSFSKRDCVSAELRFLLPRSLANVPNPWRSLSTTVSMLVLMSVVFGCFMLRIV